MQLRPHSAVSSPPARGAEAHVLPWGTWPLSPPGPGYEWTLVQLKPGGRRRPMTPAGAVFGRGQ